MQACALVPGDLLKSHDGQVIAVESLQDTQRDVTLYNMRIEEYHTYFVGSAAWGFSVWAHNANCGGMGGLADKAGDGSKALDQLISISEAQQRIRNGIDNGQNIIDDITKSERRLKNALQGPYDPADWE